MEAMGDVPFHYGSTWTFDWLVIKTDGSGNKQWSKDIGGTGDEDQQAPYCLWITAIIS